MMDDIKPNSRKYKDEQDRMNKKKIESVVTEPVVTRKKSEFRKITDMFISEDVTSVKSYILTEVLIPAIRDLLYEIGEGSLSMILGRGNSKKNLVSSKSSFVSYEKFSDNRGHSSSFGYEPRGRIDFEEFVFGNRGEAEAVLKQMIEVINHYQVVTVADLYDMVNRTAPFTHNKYGWTNLNNADVQRVREGYVIKLPRPKVID